MHLYAQCRNLQESCEAVVQELQHADEAAETYLTSCGVFRTSKACCANLAAMVALWRATQPGEERHKVCEHADAALNGDQVAPNLRALLRSARLGRGTWVK